MNRKKRTQEEQKEFEKKLLLMAEESKKRVPMGTGSHFGYDTNFFSHSPLNFVDANITLLPYGETKEELKHMYAISEVMRLGCNAKSELSLNTIVRKIISEETSINLDDYKLYTSASGARGAMLKIFEKVVSEEKPFVLFSSPNWAFDRIISNMGISGMSFHATDADSFVERIQLLKDLDKISSVILVDPANPLGYRFKQEHIEAIESLASKYGFVPIFDDVFRGLQKKGERHSSSEYSRKSIIIETTSKRYGERGLGITWTLVPKNIASTLKPELSIGCDGCESIASVVINALSQTGYDQKINTFLTMNSQAFKRGYEEHIGEFKEIGELTQPFEGSPIMLYRLKDKTSESIAGMISTSDIISASSGVDWIMHPDEKKDKQFDYEKEFGRTYIRICPTKETSDRAYIAGTFLARFIINAHMKPIVVVPEENHTTPSQDIPDTDKNRI